MPAFPTEFFRNGLADARASANNHDGVRHGMFS
jgi:hypothetical protein